MRFSAILMLTTFISQEKLSMCNFSDFSIFFCKIDEWRQGSLFLFENWESAVSKTKSIRPKKYLKKIEKSICNSNFKKYQKSKKEMFSILLIFLRKVKKKQEKFD